MPTRKVIFAHMTIVTTAGVRYAADQITASLRDGDLHPMVSFLCSGRLMVKDAYEIERIEYHAPNSEITDICNHCDQHVMAEVSVP